MLKMTFVLVSRIDLIWLLFCGENKYPTWDTKPSPPPLRAKWWVFYLLFRFQITDCINQDDLDDVMGNDEERFTDNCGWPGNERVTVSLIYTLVNHYLLLFSLSVYFIIFYCVCFLFCFLVRFLFVDWFIFVLCLFFSFFLLLSIYPFFLLLSETFCTDISWLNTYNCHCRL